MKLFKIKFVPITYAIKKFKKQTGLKWSNKLINEILHRMLKFRKMIININGKWYIDSEELKLVNFKGDYGDMKKVYKSGSVINSGKKPLTLEFIKLNDVARKLKIKASKIFKTIVYKYFGKIPIAEKKGYKYICINVFDYFK